MNDVFGDDAIDYGQGESVDMDSNQYTNGYLTVPENGVDGGISSILSFELILGMIMFMATICVVAVVCFAVGMVASNALARRQKVVHETKGTKETV